MKADLAAFTTVAEAGNAADLVPGVQGVFAAQAGEEELSPVVDDVRLVDDPDRQLIFLGSDVDDAQGVLGEAADLAACKEDRGLQLRRRGAH